MANRKNLVRMLVIMLVFGMMAVGCDIENTHDHSASLYVKNVSSITYYVKKSDEPMWKTVTPGRDTFFLVFWNEGESGNITIYYQSTGTSATYWNTRSYVLSKSERRYVDIP